ncbi:hypothetical protein HETIRDRAFT_102501 [Heterobasidion irregulare TC 32-1]|uniref:Uncharacterized protein n=1 Tax=Heterobasidion irregulare (strain TC 32-1) TaxID=747525 RepID=W4KFN6_HETIT|nr:uncharacterized protein HETIRDRAFT_102501 [Heterobasidion irregulare TC 32-1]ETW83851.1 hypothetical protein HETIRDRAFT_102501 [Heterobasidion irregulare TC 32-1]
MAFSVPKLFIFAAVLACAFVANAGPLSRRQVGNAQCNIDRLKFVVNLQETSDQINKLATELANTNFSSTVDSAQSGIDGAFQATDGIADAIFSNQTAPPELRNQVGGNLTIVLKALLSINTTDPTASATLENAKSFFQTAAEASNDVVEDCH